MRCKQRRPQARLALAGVLLVGCMLAGPRIGFAASGAPAQTASVTLQQGLDALHAGHAQQALAVFQQLLAADPSNATANLLAASAAIQLFEPQQAVAYAEKARSLEPNNWKIDTTLVTAYAMAGDTQKRDHERWLLQQAHANPALPEAQSTSGFLLDRFRAGAYTVDAVQYFRPIGTFNTYYRFLVHNAAGALVWTIQLDSDSLNEVSWAQQYPREAKEGERQFQIESSPGNGQVSYGTFTGQPNYDYVKGKVVQVLEAQKNPFPPMSQ